MNVSDKIFVAGHKGLVGSAIVRGLEKEGYQNIVKRSSKELDLKDQGAVWRFFEEERPEYIFLAAAKVGGIYANQTFPADFIFDNMAIQLNVLHAAYKYGVKKLLFLGSSCIYPKLAPQPMKESYLLTGELEPTNEPYAIAKISGIKLCEAYNRQYGTKFFAVMPTNLYGINDNFDLKTSHVLPALIRKIDEAKRSQHATVEIWGTGTPKREFLFADDLADACIFLMNDGVNYDGELINIGTGQDLSIKELAQTIKEIVGYEGELVFNPSMPDGTPRKLLDVSKLAGLGWEARTSLEEGIRTTYQWYLQSLAQGDF